MIKNSSKRRFFKLFNLFSMGALILNMSLMGVFFVSTEVNAEYHECQVGWDCVVDGYFGCHEIDECVPYEECGDEEINGSEECDNGEANYPEGTMDPVWNMDEGLGDRSYCSDTCYIYDVPGVWCGDGEINGPEECDEGQSNGAECDPEYDDSCTFCTAECGEETLEGGYCGDDIIQQNYEECEVDGDCSGGYMCEGCSCVEIGETTGTIEICKQNDINRNGKLDEEPFMDGWSFYVNDVMHTEDGDCVVLDEMPYGTYVITEVAQDGWELTGAEGNGTFEASTSEFTIELDSSHEIAYFLNKAMICGTKYNYDIDNETIPGWEFNLSQTTGTSCDGDACMSAIAWIASTTTNSEGEFCFDPPYGSGPLLVVSEVMQDGWTLHSASNDTTFEFDGTAPYFVDFYNYQESSEPYCGDGECSGDENCENCEIDCGSCGGSECVCGNGICESECDECCESCPSDCGSCSSGGEDPECGNGVKESGEECDGEDGVPSDKVCNSECKLKPKGGGTLIPTNRFGSSPSPSTPSPTPVVLGEEGAPELVVEKTANTEFANPGDKGVEFSVIVKNNGNLTAFDVVLKDTLPAGLTYSDDGASEKTWGIGDLAPGESKEVKYTVDVAEDVDPSTLTNIAEASASNHASVSDTADIEIKSIKVLAVTGFSYFELLLILSLILFGHMLRKNLKHRLT